MNLDNNLPLEQEQDFETAEQLFKCRMRLKKLSQLSYELKAIEVGMSIDMYGSYNAKNMVNMYQLVEAKVLEVAEDIKNNN